MEADKFIAIEMRYQEWKVFTFEDGLKMITLLGKSITVNNENTIIGDKILNIRFLTKDDLDNVLVKKMLGIKEE